MSVPARPDIGDVMASVALADHRVMPGHGSTVDDDLTFLISADRDPGGRNRHPAARMEYLRGDRRSPGPRRRPDRRRRAELLDRCRNRLRIRRDRRRCDPGAGVGIAGPSQPRTSRTAFPAAMTSPGRSSRGEPGSSATPLTVVPFAERRSSISRPPPPEEESSMPAGRREVFGKAAVAVDATADRELIVDGDQASACPDLT